MRAIKRMLKLFHYKWVSGNCRHICTFCNHREKCVPSMYGELNLK